jgi:hypothetical protein
VRRVDRQPALIRLARCPEDTQAQLLHSCSCSMPIAF